MLLLVCLANFRFVYALDGNAAKEFFDASVAAPKIRFVSSAPTWAERCMGECLVKCEQLTYNPDNVMSLLKWTHTDDCDYR